MKNLRITVNGTAYDVQVEELGGSSAPAAAAPALQPLPLLQQSRQLPQALRSVVVKAPMPGTVVNVVVSAGQLVKAGDDPCSSRL